MAGQGACLSAADAAEVDRLLMSSPEDGGLGFCLEQLMELAGLSVACAIESTYRHDQHKQVLVVCGPGNNGGDGLVAARHLWHFGYQPHVCYPKRSSREVHYARLVAQLDALAVPFVDDASAVAAVGDGTYGLVVDAMFGFSFAGAPRPPFDAVLTALAADGAPPIVSVDVPSGWPVDGGEPAEGVARLQPDMLVSLTAPKPCASVFRGAHHFLGGRFVPPAIAARFGLQLPPYPAAAQCVRL